MNVWAFVVLLAAAIVFLVDFLQTRALLAVGLTLATVGLILVYVVTGTTVHL